MVIAIFKVCTKFNIFNDTSCVSKKNSNHGEKVHLTALAFEAMTRPFYSVNEARMGSKANSIEGKW